MSVDLKTGQPFPRGAKPSPRHKLLAATPHLVLVAPPQQFAVVPPKLAMWDNDRDGVCVSSEEAFAKAAWSVYCGLPEVFASDSEVRTFAARHGWLDGATLTDVMDVMIAEGMSVGGTTYKDGGYNAVDYSDEVVLQSALSTGPVKIAIDASALPGGAGNGSGWYATGGGHYPNTDHCVGLCGYGLAGWLYQQLGRPLPAGLSADTPGYLLFTWSSIGFVTHAWLMGTCTEAWVRVPTTPGQAPPLPPGPGPGPGPLPPPGPQPLVVTVPDQQLVTGAWPFRSTVTVKGGTYPVTTGTPHAAVALSLFDLLAKLRKYLPALLDLVAIVAAIRSGDYSKLPPEILKLLADLGLLPAA